MDVGVVADYITMIYPGAFSACYHISCCEYVVDNKCNLQHALSGVGGQDVYIIMFSLSLWATPSPY